MPFADSENGVTITYYRTQTIKGHKRTNESEGNAHHPSNVLYLLTLTAMNAVGIIFCCLIRKLSKNHQINLASAAFQPLQLLFCLVCFLCRFCKRICNQKHTLRDSICFFCTLNVSRISSYHAMMSRRCLVCIAEAGKCNSDRGSRNGHEAHQCIKRQVHDLMIMLKSKASHNAKPSPVYLLSQGVRSMLVDISCQNSTFNLFILD